MSEQDSTKREADHPKTQCAHGDVGLDIENALSFIDSEEYGDVSSPPLTGNKPKSPETGEVELMLEESLKTAAKEDGHVPVLRQIEKEPRQKPFFPPDDTQQKGGPALWIILVAAAVLIVLAVFFLL